tara:strand:+ start:428 stop:1105 length:678 start_codon:yes stop_codon:yes gene_type:complete
MNELSNRQLLKLIREALTRHEACCLARHSPMYGIELQNRSLYKKEERIGLVGALADIIQNRADLSGKDWDAKKSDWDIMLQSYDKDVEQRYRELEACIDGQGLGQDEVDACSAGEEGDYEEEEVTSSSAPTMEYPFNERNIKHMIREELTKTDETDIKKLIAKELSTSTTDIAKSVKKVIEDELSKALKTKDIKDDITDITKKVMKRLYKDLSYHHPYIIDRIKV